MKHWCFSSIVAFFEIYSISEVASNINDFRTFLQQDDLGNKMAIVSENCRGRPKYMVMEVLTEWLAGKGVEVSWESLTSTLKKSKLPLMVEQQLQMALDQL